MFERGSRANKSLAKRANCVKHRVIEFLEKRTLLSISTTDAINFVQNTWNITNLSSDTITHTLDTEYSGIPFSNLIDALVHGTSITNELVNGQYSAAATDAYSYGVSLGQNFALNAVGLTGVADVAQLATWPIINGLNNFYQVAESDALNEQSELYFQALKDGTNPQEILADATKGQVNLLLTGNAAIYVEGDGWLQGELDNGHVLEEEPIGGITPVEFYTYEQNQWNAAQAESKFNPSNFGSDSATLKAA